MSPVGRLAKVITAGSSDVADRTGDGGGIEPAAQAGPDGYVAAHAQAYGVEEQLAKPFDLILEGGRRRLKVVAGPPPAPDGDFTAMKDGDVTGGQAPDALYQGSLAALHREGVEQGAAGDLQVRPV